MKRASAQFWVLRQGGEGRDGLAARYRTDRGVLSTHLGEAKLYSHAVAHEESLCSQMTSDCVSDWWTAVPVVVTIEELQ